MLQKKHKATILLTVIVAAFFISTPVISAETTSDTEHKPLSKSDNTAIDVARSNLEKAIDSYRKGDMAATRHHLETAVESLEKSARESTTEKTREASRKLSLKIDEFKEMLIQESEQDENSLLRFWHQATSIVKRETDNLIHRYVELSVSEKTLKYLLDAKMHLFMAQHDLLTSHDDEDAAAELDNVLDYLDEAKQVAKPVIQKQLADLSREIQALKQRIKPGQETWRDNDMILFLDQAVANLNKAETNASAQIKSRLETLETEIQILQVEIQRSNIKNDYEAAMEQLKKIIHAL